MDEIGDLPLHLQVKLLRAIQEKAFQRVGDTETHRVDVRIVAATNRDLKAGMGDGWFREDLYYRLNVIPIKMPPLRHRREDIPRIADFFLAKYGACHRPEKLPSQHKGHGGVAAPPLSRKRS